MNALSQSWYLKANAANARTQGEDCVVESDVQNPDDPSSLWYLQHQLPRHRVRDRELINVLIEKHLLLEAIQKTCKAFV